MTLRFSGPCNAEMRNEIQGYHNEALEILKERFAKWLPVLENLQVNFSPRLKTCLGQALANRTMPELSWIKLHSRAFATATTAADRRSTYMHELAHIVASLHYNTQCGHDYRWKVIAMTLGDSGERCHKVDVSAFQSKRSTKTYTWNCGCQSFQLKQGRHNKALLRSLSHGCSGFTCKRCKQYLTLDAAALLKQI